MKSDNIFTLRFGIFPVAGEGGRRYSLNEQQVVMETRLSDAAVFSVLGIPPCILVVKFLERKVRPNSTRTFRKMDDVFLG